ncbi:MAG: hypothetical protein IPH87_16470 [Anaerolineae bacterium]|nr:hypothetical protein [Anaerolineae bacterium]
MLKRSPRYVADLALRYEGVVLLVAAPFLLFPNSITPFALALLALPWLLRWWRHGFLTRRTPLDWPLAPLALMAFVGARQAVDPALALPVARHPAQPGHILHRHQHHAPHPSRLDVDSPTADPGLGSGPARRPGR